MYEPCQFHPASIANNLQITLQIFSSDVNIVNSLGNDGMFPYPAAIRWYWDKPGF